MESRCRASPEQFAALLEFMESYGDIARPQQGSQGRLRGDRLWQVLRESLNSIGGGVMKSKDKWKKVWADWKTKTKKKALVLRREASRTGGGLSSRQTLTAMEQRVLGIMGLSSVVRQIGIKRERGFDEPPLQRNSITPPPRDAILIELTSQNNTDDIMLDFIPIEGHSASSRPPSSEVSRLSTPQVSPSLPMLVSMPSATSSNATLQGAPGRQRRQATPPPVASPTSTPRQRPFRARTRKVQTPFERATSEFAAIENRRLQLEEDREKNTHQREMERLRLESRRVEMEEKRNQVLFRLAGVLDSLAEILPQLRPNSLPNTDILP